jgi:hypothetical protein
LSRALVAGPVKTTSPRATATTSSATSRPASAFCSTMRIPIPESAIARTLVRIESTTAGARPIEGSSRSITLGCDINARPKASICCSPPLSSPAAAWLRSDRIGNIS